MIARYDECIFTFFSFKARLKNQFVIVVHARKRKMINSIRNPVYENAFEKKKLDDLINAFM